MDDPNHAEVGQVTKPVAPAPRGTAPGPVIDHERRDRVALPDRGGRHVAPRPDRPRLHLRPLIGLFGLVLFMVAIGILLIRVINQSQPAVEKGAQPSSTEELPPPVASGGFAVAGNLLRNWSFEADTDGWQRIGSARLSRELGGRTSGSSAFVQASSTGPSTVGMAAPAIAQVHAGEVYEASAWVRSGTPGVRVIVSLVVTTGQGGRDASTAKAVTAANPGWVRVDVDHRVKTAGVLSFEVSLQNARLGEGLLVDEVTVHRG